MARARQRRVERRWGYVLWYKAIEELLEDEKRPPLAPKERHESFDGIRNDQWQQAER